MYFYVNNNYFRKKGSKPIYEGFYYERNGPTGCKYPAVTEDDAEVMKLNVSNLIGIVEFSSSFTTVFLFY